MKVTFLGTGTSTGVPQIGCDCSVCVSPDARDKRTRSSVLVETDTGLNILIDCGPDFYHQILGQNSPALQAALLTHSHYDHVGGIDDLRPYCKNGSFPVYCQNDVAHDLRTRVPYCFAKKLYPGVPTFDITYVDPYVPFHIGEVCITPLEVMHHKPILGFKIENLAYITDCKTLPNRTIQTLKGIDTLIINALRIKPHPSHQSLAEALRVIEKIHPRVAYLTHVSHQLGRHEDVSPILPENVFLAYDGLQIFVKN
ncbi:MAG: MBL fold metallo-hydrolase [Muribaculaceae bacterium]|nr:MBL fold metallo-hydrolase [Muribaculaceae bacterium]